MLTKSAVDFTDCKTLHGHVSKDKKCRPVFLRGGVADNGGTKPAQRALS